MLPDLAPILGSLVPPIKVIDVGAMLLETPVYASVLALPGATLVAFEPGEEELAKLRKDAPSGHVFLPHVVGRGGPATFRTCAWNATSSLYEPNTALLRRFSGMARQHTVARRDEVMTVRLDDVPETKEATYLKVDVQGAELDVITGADRMLESVVAIHVEVQFVPLYEGVPLFADVDTALRKKGFCLHQTTMPGTGSFAPMTRPQGSLSSQHLWTDALYVRDFMRFADLAPRELLQLALIVERGYRSHDLALYALQHYDAKTGSDLWSRFCEALVGRVVQKPPL